MSCGSQQRYVELKWQQRDSNTQLLSSKKRTLNHLAKPAKWLSCVVSTFLYIAFNFMLLLALKTLFYHDCQTRNDYLQKISLKCSGIHSMHITKLMKCWHLLFCYARLLASIWPGEAFFESIESFWSSILVINSKF